MVWSEPRTTCNHGFWGFQGNLLSLQSLLSTLPVDVDLELFRPEFSRNGGTDDAGNDLGGRGDSGRR